MAEQENVNSSAGESMPSVSGKSSADILGMINSPQPQVNPQAAGSQPEAQSEPKIDTSKPENPIDALDKVPDKFKNPDGTLDAKRLLGSYLEAEKSLGKLQNTAHEGQKSVSELESLRQLTQELKAQLQQTSAPKDPNAPKYTPEEVELIQNDPEKWLEQKLQQHEMKQKADMAAARLKDFEMVSAINLARAKLPGFSSVESEIKQMVDDNIFSEDPRSIELAYHAAIGKKTEALVQYASQKAYKDGYEKAKTDLRMQVDGGGKDSAPVKPSLNVGQSANYSTEELKKMLPRSPYEI